MNENARKKARRAELEYRLLKVREKLGYPHDSFADFLERHSTDADASYQWDDAKELIALYESEPTGEREGL